MCSSKSYIKFISSLLIFGSNGIVAGFIALKSTEIVFYRSLIGSVFLIALLSVRKHRPALLKNRRHFLYLAAAGVSMGASWMFLYEAYNLVGVSMATLIYYCGPVIVMALSPFIFKEKLTLPKLMGFAAVLVGMFLVNSNSLSGGGFSSGILYAFAGAIFFALMMVFNKKATGITGLENSAIQLFGAFAVTAFFLILNGGLPTSLPRQSIIPVLIIGIVNTGIGTALYFSGMKALPVQTIAVCGYIEPLSALIFSVVFLSEHLTAPQITGAALILSGAAAGELLSGRKVRLGYVTIKLPYVSIAKGHN
ncbi:DMT family transporter [Lachnospiraceae bacterium NSJ-143]|nr:DMT family transporter [Lachnospiraceae bacterium NSJ-143]